MPKSFIRKFRTVCKISEFRCLTYANKQNLCGSYLNLLAFSILMLGNASQSNKSMRVFVDSMHFQTSLRILPNPHHKGFSIIPSHRWISEYTDDLKKNHEPKYLKSHWHSSGCSLKSIIIIWYHLMLNYSTHNHTSRVNSVYVDCVKSIISPLLSFLATLALLKATNKSFECTDCTHSEKSTSRSFYMSECFVELCSRFGLM